MLKSSLDYLQREGGMYVCVYIYACCMWSFWAGYVYNIYIYIHMHIPDHYVMGSEVMRQVFGQCFSCFEHLPDFFELPLNIDLPFSAKT